MQNIIQRCITRLISSAVQKSETNRQKFQTNRHSRHSTQHTTTQNHKKHQHHKPPQLLASSGFNLLSGGGISAVEVGSVAARQRQ
jgi:hypothetical protein